MAGFGRQGDGIFSKASNFPEVPPVRIAGEVSWAYLQWSGTETGVGWGWDCSRDLWQVIEEHFAPLSVAHSYSCPCLQPLSPLLCSRAVCVVVAWRTRLVAWCRRELKWKNISVAFGLYFRMYLLSSGVYRVATKTWTSMENRVVQEWERAWRESRAGAAESLLMLEMTPQSMLPKHRRCCHHRG